jgi:uncharacterized membrane protein
MALLDVLIKLLSNKVELVMSHQWVLKAVQGLLLSVSAALLFILAVIFKVILRVLVIIILILEGLVSSRVELGFACLLGVSLLQMLQLTHSSNPSIS